MTRSGGWSFERRVVVIAMPVIVLVVVVVVVIVVVVFFSSDLCYDRRWTDVGQTRLFLSLALGMIGFPRATIISLFLKKYRLASF
jgi:hypothetical protein